MTMMSTTMKTNFKRVSNGGCVWTSPLSCSGLGRFAGRDDAADLIGLFVREVEARDETSKGVSGDFFIRLVVFLHHELSPLADFAFEDIFNGADQRWIKGSDVFLGQFVIIGDEQAGARETTHRILIDTGLPIPAVKLPKSAQHR